ncbi:MAG: terminase [Planctomycetes bacterium]|nr:terminase [Planctomycetota bacterium]
MGKREQAQARDPNATDDHLIWRANPGSQTRFLRCPVFEVLLEGTRGGGKSDVLLMDFAHFVNRGYGRDWRGILFRQSYPALEEVIERCFKWFPAAFPGAQYNASKHVWRFPQGEALYLRYAEKERDYYKYHGHEYPWIGWEELTNWANDDLYMSMFSVCRSSNPHVPRHYRATCNPYGVGHNWVKSRFIDPAPRGKIIQDEQGRERVAIHSSLQECPQLAVNDPNYVRSLRALSGPKLQAWLFGNWDIVAGGMFDDVWDPKVHILEPFPIPASWYVDRSFDWGSARPYSVGWWAESDGTDIVLADGSTLPTRRGDLFRIAELYGWTGKPNEGTRELAATVARRIRETEQQMKLVVRPGPADSAIFSRDNGKCIADDMAAQSVRWRKVSKESGSRRNGWELMRSRLKNAMTGEGPGLYVLANCRQFIRTVPSLPRDERDMDDVDTEAEDHVGDESRYRVLMPKVVSSLDQF